MYKLDSKKIANSLKSLENAAKGAVRSLNEMTNNEFKDSMMEKEPLKNVGLIIRTLENAQAKAAANAQYDGMTPEEISEAQEQARTDQQANIQKKFQEKLAARQAKPAVEEPTDTELEDDTSEQNNTTEATPEPDKAAETTPEPDKAAESAPEPDKAVEATSEPQ